MFPLRSPSVSVIEEFTVEALHRMQQILVQMHKTKEKTSIGMIKAKANPLLLTILWFFSEIYKARHAPPIHMPD